jgi:hypothetical protein
MLRGRWCDIIVLNVHAETEDRSDNMKDELDQFRKYHTKMVVGNFNVKVEREDNFKPTVGNENLHEISNDTGV